MPNPSVIRNDLQPKSCTRIVYYFESDRIAKSMGTMGVWRDNSLCSEEWPLFVVSSKPHHVLRAEKMISRPFHSGRARIIVLHWGRKEENLFLTIGRWQRTANFRNAHAWRLSTGLSSAHETKIMTESSWLRNSIGDCHRGHLPRCWFHLATNPKKSIIFSKE